MPPSSSPHSPKPLFDVRMMLPRSYRADTRVKKAVADLLVQAGNQGGLVLGLLGLTVAEDPGGAFGQGFLPS